MAERILFLNQMAGPLFRELAEDLARRWPGSRLLTGHPDTLAATLPDDLQLLVGPGYDRRSNLRRLWSWLRFFAAAVRTVFTGSRQDLLLIVSNPPFLGLVGLMARRLRGQPYVMLVYDIYPQLLVRLGRLRPGLVSRLWQGLNRLVYNQAQEVITLGADMAAELAGSFDVGRTRSGKVRIIPAWADTDKLRPWPVSSRHPLREQLGLEGKTVVLYSGNMGESHAIEDILAAAACLQELATLHFLFVGEGRKRGLVEEYVAKYPGGNVSLLPWQPEEALPVTLTGGDIGLVAYQSGTEGLLLPSKSYYYLAAGLPLLVLGDPACDPARQVVQAGAGASVAAGDIPALAARLRDWGEDRAKLQPLKRAARELALARFSRRNSEDFVRLLEPLMAPAASPATRRSPLLKRLFDLLVVGLTLPLWGLLVVLLAGLVRLKLGRPVFFRQPRPGLNGKVFPLYKFRTMTVQNDAAGNLLPDAERMTPFGAWLRATSLDELPTLWNVLSGSMSLVGPRPLLTAYLERYTPEQARRHLVRPGITGWAQIHGRNAISWEEKFALDVWYVDHGSLRLDLSILARTLGKVLRREGISATDAVTMPEYMGEGKEDDDAQ